MFPGRTVLPGPHQELANLQMEPTPPTVCAIMSLRRAAHLARWADPEQRSERKRAGTRRKFNAPHRTPFRSRALPRVDILIEPELEVDSTGECLNLIRERGATWKQDPSDVLVFRGE